MRSMHQPRGDPFFKQLKADIQEGIDSADRGDLASPTKCERDSKTDGHTKARVQRRCTNPRVTPFPSS